MDIVAEEPPKRKQAKVMKVEYEIVHIIHYLMKQNKFILSDLFQCSQNLFIFVH